MLVALITSFHGSQISWEDAVLFSLAGALVYPDQILEWMSAKTGRVFGWLHLIAFESAVAGLMTLAMFLMMPLSPTLVWREPFLIGRHSIGGLSDHEYFWIRRLKNRKTACRWSQKPATPANKSWCF